MASTVTPAAAPPRDSPRPTWAEALHVVPVLVQLGLAGLVIWYFHLESRGVFRIFALATVAFPVHALLPLRYRLPFFTALSFAGIGVIFGVQDGALLVGAGLALILACHLPVRFAMRVAVVVLLAVFFALARTGVLILPVSAAVWPILASMFMFRLALYMHALRHDPGPRSPVRTLAYFFMLPNVCYPLYPVVDYNAFGRTHYDAPPQAIYQRGATWIIRGLVHLLLYRFVYLHVTMDPAQVASLGDLIRFMLATFLLYLRVSGQFHLIVGMLHLFGFHLPETHRLYFLASSFTDFWRRINIYWKDYMMKLVFYPSFFRLRRHGETLALVVGTLVVFGATWMLHSYQWFWLRGSFPLTLQDALFWIVLGVLVVDGSLRERRRSRKRTLRTAPQRWSGALALRTVGVFTTMCVIWSLWSSESVAEWLTLWTAAGNVDANGLLLLGALLAVGLLIAGRVWDPPVTPATPSAAALRADAARGSLMLASLLLIGQPAVSAQGGEQFASVVASLRSVALNQHDRTLQHQGYYEGLDDRGRLSAELWSLYGSTPADWVPFQDTEAYRQRDDFLLADLRPDVQGVMVKGAPFSTNTAGMRDREYSPSKEPGTIRIAVLGPSHTAGSGVADDAVFDVQLEADLNATAPAGTRYEVLNFSVPTYSFVQQVALLEMSARAYDPDIVIVTATGRTYFNRPLTRHLMTALRRGIPIPHPELRQLMTDAGIQEAEAGEEGVTVPFEWLRAAFRSAGVAVRMPDRELQQRLESITDDVARWAIDRVAAVSAGIGATPSLLMLDLVGMEGDDAPAVLEEAEARGFVVLDLRDVYEGYDVDEVRLGEWDNHPNDHGHALIAERLAEQLRSQFEAPSSDEAARTDAVRAP